MDEKLKWECDYCGKVLYEGEKAVLDELTLGIWCSPRCWAIQKGHYKTRILTKETINDNQEAKIKYGN